MQTGGIVILDFGSQYTQLIAKSIRKQHVFSQILGCGASKSDVMQYQPHGVILSGGAPVERSGSGEYGFTMIAATGAGELLDGTPPSQQVWMSHGDKVAAAGEGMRVLASSPNSEIAAFAHPERRLFGVQFHPEVQHTVHGRSILGNFLFKICGCSADWLPENIVREKVDEIRRATGNGRVLCAVSGGVDSSVTATLVSAAIGERLVCVFVDNGLLRQGERKSVESFLGSHLSSPLRVIDARERFLKRLAGVTDPEEKRKRIGNLFVDIFDEVSTALGPFEFLAQGTLYPDRIESSSTFGPSDTIKTHHNVGGLPERLNFTLLEPLAFLFKDEVRELGYALGLPDELINRHPFPGPGLAVRVLGEVTEEKLDLLRRADKIFIDGLHKWKLYDRVWQAGVILLPVKSVGVMGDARTYQYVVALRAVTSADGMTADWAVLDNAFLKEVSNDIINAIQGINRVVYDISSKPPSTIEWE
jgi:GMP synthase (glutamine-hydrolysing)